MIKGGDRLRLLMSVKEVAAALGVAPETVRMNLDKGIWTFGRSYVKEGHSYKTYEIQRAAFERFCRGE